LDPDDASLSRAGARLPLTPKCFALLAYLVAHPGRLVTKDELLDAVWPETHVADAVLKVRMRELRAVLGDDAGAPRFIETVHRRGYRFIAEVRSEAVPAAGSDPALVASATEPLIGRDAELQELDRRFAEAQAAKRQIVFVSGEAGIGKTALIDAFAGSLPRATRVGRGFCIEHHGGGEAYLPLLEALGNVARGDDAAEMVAALRRYAPSWLAQLPWLLDVAEREVLQRELLGTTRERMLRELAEAVEALAASHPLVLVLEDLHWSDPSTVDALSVIAHRRTPARVLVVATYRPVDTILNAHPLKGMKQRLDQQRLCSEIHMPLFSREHVRLYLERRLGAAKLPGGLVDPVHERTAGNPLFVTSLIDLMLDRGWLVREGETHRLTVAPSTIWAEVPEGIRLMIDRQIESLSKDEARVLEAASVAGAEFSAVGVAAALEARIEDVAVVLHEEARRGRFLRVLGAAELGEAKISERYCFSHALHRDVFYRNLPASRRVDLHRRIGEWQERSGATPAELASHFAAAAEAGGARKAVTYAVRAAERARALLGYAEAARHYDMALRALALEPGDFDRERCRLLISLGQAQERSGAMQRAAETFGAAIDLARSRGFDELFAEAALGMGRGHHVVTRADDRLIAVLEEALERLGDRQPPLRACLLARLDAALSPIPATYRRRESLAREATAIARDAGDPETLLAVMQFTRWAFCGRESRDELRMSEGQLASLAERAASREQSLQFQLMRIADLHELGDVAAAGVALEAFSLAADDAGIPWFRWFGMRLRTMRALQDGRLDDAERMADEALAFGHQMDHPNVAPVHAAQRLQLFFLRGRLAESAALLKRYIEQNPQPYSLRAVLAHVSLHGSEIDDARRELDVLAQRDFAELPRDSMWLSCLVYCAEVAAGLGDRPRAQVLLDLLLPHADRIIGVGPSLVSLGHGARYLGLLTSTLGRDREAAQYFATASGEHERMGALPWLAYSLRDEALLHARRPGNLAKKQTRELAQRALHLAREVGMPVLELDAQLRTAGGIS
jgi:DNA-binding winged helix-turn-helix (wHTH) protein/tetratricopeptide (TPR) repeat protein